MAAQVAVHLTTNDYKSKFLELIVNLAAEQKVVLLVDEYDKPITDLLENEAKVEEHIGTLKNFYAVLKSTEADHIHFALFTGVSKYGKLSVFSDLNNLLDITLDRRFATLLGYTEPEMARYFADYLAQLAATQGLAQPQLLERVRFWYDGYSWDGINRLYVPYSTLILLEQQTFGNHWFATATPSFLLKLLRLQKLPAYELEAFINILKSVFAAIPNTRFLAKGAYYHSVFYLLLNLLGFTIDVEQLTNRGRIDAVLELRNVIYIIEFKLSTAAIALSQIRNRGYAVAYQNRGKPILLLGIAFDTEERNLTDWQSEPF